MRCRTSGNIYLQHGLEGQGLQRMYWQTGICSPSSPVTKSKMFIGGGNPWKPQSDSHLKSGDWVFGLPITATLAKVMPVVSPLFEGCHRVPLRKLRGWLPHPRDVITTPSVGPTSHWHQKLNGFLLPGLQTGVSSPTAYWDEAGHMYERSGCGGIEECMSRLRTCLPPRLSPLWPSRNGVGFYQIFKFFKNGQKLKVLCNFSFLNTGNNF